MRIWCCACNEKIKPRLTKGLEIYPNNPQLYSLPFWVCDKCKNYVGCHHKTKWATRPLGNIPTPELRRARAFIHKLLDPMWKKGLFTRRQLYKRISKEVGWEYHTANLKTIEDAREVYRIILNIKREHAEQLQSAQS